MRKFSEIKLEKKEVSLPYNDLEVKFKRIFEGAWEIKVTHEGEELRSKVLLLPLEEYRIKEIPAYVDLPVTLKFAPSFLVAPRERRRVYATLPVNIELVLEFNGEELTLEELNVIELKRAWFGEPQRGTLSYYFESEIYNSPEEFEEREGIALVPLEIKNLDERIRSIERLLIDSYQLSIYDYKGKLISEVVEVTIRKGEIELEYTDRPPFPNLTELKKGEESLKRKGLTRIAKRSLGLLGGG